MKLSSLAREFVFPATHVAVAIPMILSWFLFSVAVFFGLFGLLLFLATLVPFCRYLMCLLDARAYGRDAPAFDAELMAFVGDAWSLFPLLTAGLLLWFQIVLEAKLGPGTSLAATAVLSIAFPASLGVLSVTRSPLQSLNPVALARFVVAVAVNYVQLVLVLVGYAFALVVLDRAGLPGPLVDLAIIYGLALMFSLTGAIAERRKLTDEVDIPAPLPVTESENREKLLKQRQRIANHAYGFASRGNRSGGLRHIQAHVDQEADLDDASDWFFNEMLTWDDKDAALAFAQAYLHRLLIERQDHKSLKLISQCFHADPRFRVRQEDREAAVEIAELNGRQDLIRLLR